jgi:hypothetical protein
MGKQAKGDPKKTYELLMWPEQVKRPKPAGYMKLIMKFWCMYPNKDQQETHL